MNVGTGLRIAQIGIAKDFTSQLIGEGVRVFGEQAGRRFLHPFSHFVKLARRILSEQGARLLHLNITLNAQIVRPSHRQRYGTLHVQSGKQSGDILVDQLALEVDRARCDHASFIRVLQRMEEGDSEVREGLADPGSRFDHRNGVLFIGPADQLRHQQLAFTVLIEGKMLKQQPVGIEDLFYIIYRQCDIPAAFDGASFFRFPASGRLSSYCRLQVQAWR